MKEINEKIKSLGGVTNLNENKMSIIEIENWLEKQNINQSSDFVVFLKKYGGTSFNKEIVFPNIQYIPKTDFLGQMPVSINLGFTKGNLGIVEIQAFVSNNLKKGYIAFSIGDPTGDYWVYNTSTEEIYFWIHDSDSITNSFYKVANNIQEFVLSLKEKNEKNSDNKIVDFWIADDL